MIETVLLPLFITIAENSAIPAIATFAASEIIGASRSKHNSIIQLGIGLLKAIAKELTDTHPDSGAVSAHAARAKPVSSRKKASPARQPQAG